MKFGYYRSTMHANHFGLVCDYCGKTRRYSKTYGYGFQTMDGGDYVEQESCWLCELKGWLHKHPKAAVKKMASAKSFCAELRWVLKRKKVTKYGLKKAIRAAALLSGMQSGSGKKKRG